MVWFELLSIEEEKRRLKYLTGMKETIKRPIGGGVRLVVQLAQLFLFTVESRNGWPRLPREAAKAGEVEGGSRTGVPFSRPLDLSTCLVLAVEKGVRSS